VLPRLRPSLHSEGELGSGENKGKVALFDAGGTISNLQLEGKGEKMGREKEDFSASITQKGERFLVERRVLGWEARKKEKKGGGHRDRRQENRQVASPRRTYEIGGGEWPFLPCPQ